MHACVIFLKDRNTPQTQITVSLSLFTFLVVTKVEIGYSVAINLLQLSRKPHKTRCSCWFWMGTHVKMFCFNKTQARGYARKTSDGECAFDLRGSSSEWPLEPLK